MNKMLTGAIAISASALLLVGGGGTLAMWNVEKSVQPGTITAGSMELNAETGSWTDKAGKTIDVATYKIVPGDVLTYTQKFDINLAGDKIAAKLFIDGNITSTFASEDVDVDFALTDDSDGQDVWPTSDWSVYLEKSADLTGTLVFTFGSAPTMSGSTTDLTASAGATFRLSDVQFRLTQVPRKN